MSTARRNDPAWDGHRESPSEGLPPGQRRVAALRRFGTHLHERPPRVPTQPRLSVGGAVAREIDVSLEHFRALPRTEMTADLHCVAGWSATGLRWEGVAFATFYDEVIAPALIPGTRVTHIVTEGLDGYRCPVLLQDALEPDVLLADTLDGEPLTGDNGAPLRYVSPRQYGFVSNKHVRRVEAHEGDPDWRFGTGSVYGRAMLPPLFSRHPRARVWAEERNNQVPNWLIRPVYRLITPPIAWLSGRGSRSR